MPDNGAPRDSRANVLYADEQAPLTWREAWRILVKSWPFVSRYRRLVAIKCVLVFVSLTFYLMTPWPLKIVIDNVLDGHPLTGIPASILTPMVGANRTALLIAVSLFLVLTVILIGMVHGDAQSLGTNVNSGGLDQAGITANDANDGGSLWNGLFGYLESRITIDLTQRMNQSLRTAIYERFLRSPLALYADQKIGDAVFRVMYDSASIGPVFYRGVLAPIMSVFMFVMAIIVLSMQFSNEPVIVVVAILFLPVIAIGSALFGRAIRDQSQSMRESGSNVMAAFEERVAQVQLIKAFGQESRETAVVDAASWQSFRSTLRMLAIWFVMVIVLAPVCCVLIGYSLYYLMMQVIAGRMTLGDIVLLASYGGMLANPMGIIGGTWASIQASVAGLRRVHSVLDNLAEPVSDGGSDGLGTRISNLKFSGVAVGYGATTVLSGVTMSMRAGEMVALAGPSGCGKTTLIHSIPRFIEPSAGTIAFDGVDSRAVAPDTIRARMGFVFQNESLFSTSIEDNIRYGSDSASPADVREAAAMAGAAEFIDRLPDGYATMLGRRGARLSVGQKQRIAIARALLRRPEIIVLDEPAAPLDPVSESDLLKTLAALARDRIVIIVAHRAGTLAACDKVFFIHGKTIGAAGTHAHLLATDRDYQAYLAQSATEIPA
jgi:ATP-binding cassette, subfamily B, bacterial